MQKIETEDIILIEKVLKDPCINCNDEVPICPKKIEYMKIVNSIPEEKREHILEVSKAYREYVKAVDTIEKLQAKIERLKYEYDIDKIAKFI